MAAGDARGGREQGADLHLVERRPEHAEPNATGAEHRVRLLELLDAAPRAGLAGQIAFVHPKASCGILVELATPSATVVDVPSPVRLKSLVVGAADVRRASDVLRSLFGLEEVAMNGGPRSMLAVGRGAVLVVPAEEVGGMEGLVALSMQAEDFVRLQALGQRHG